MTINAARARAGRDARHARGGQQGRPRRLGRAVACAAALLAGREPGARGGQARPRGLPGLTGRASVGAERAHASHGRRAAQTLPCDSSRTTVVSGARSSGHRELGRRLGRAGRSSRGGTASSRGGLVLADRHGHDQVGVELRDQLGGAGGGEATTDGHAGDVDRCRSRPASPRSGVADVAQVDHCTPSSSKTKQVLAPRWAPFSSSRYVRTPVIRTWWTSYSPGESSRKAGSRLVGTRRPSSSGALLAPCRAAGRGLAIGVAVGHDVGGQAAAGRADDRAIRVRDDDALCRAGGCRSRRTR